MYTQTIPVNNEKQIELKVDRDLELRGWDKTEISAATVREGDLYFTTIEDKLVIESRGELELTVPRDFTVTIRKVKGDADIADLSGLLSIGGVEGDLDLDNTGQTQVSAVGGDLDAKKLASLDVTSVGGDCSVERITGAVRITNVGGDLEAAELGSLQLINVGGDCSVRDIAGDFSVTNIGGDLNGAGLSAKISAMTAGGDLNLRVKQGGAKAMAGGDLRVGFDELTGEPVSLSAGGDINLHLPPQSSSKMHISSGGGDIMMRVGGWNERVEMFSFDFTLGDGKTPINVTAGGDVVVSDGDFETRKGARAGAGAFEFGGVKVDVDAITNTVQDAVERATRSAERASREVEERIQAAMRRVEDKNRKQGFNIRFGSITDAPPIPPAPTSFPSGVPGTPVSPAQPAQPAQSKVSEDERKLVLQMLHDQKISAEEAIHLLDTLEGKNQ